jgi:DNA-binding transcriptional ArsR family regulator
MRDGPNIAPVASLIGDPARAAMLTALADGRALTASELAHEAGVTLSTASAHLAKLRTGGLIAVAADGRHRYFRLAGADVGAALEALMGLVARTGDGRVRTGPREPAMRQARVCYDHLAGEMGVQLLDSLRARRFIAEPQGVVALTTRGKAFIASLGVDLASLTGARRPMCRLCLDWSARRMHLAGGLGAALLLEILAKCWARRELAARTLRFSPAGAAAFAKAFPV